MNNIIGLALAQETQGSQCLMYLLQNPYVPALVCDSNLVCALVCAPMFFLYKLPICLFCVCDDSTTLSETMDIILPGLRYASGDHSGGCYAPHFLRQERSPPTLTVLRPAVFRKPGRSQGLLYRYLCH